jgi:twitching motility protein PilT
MPNEEEKSTFLIDELLEKTIAKGASDLHLSNEMPPIVRVTGILQPLSGFKKLAANDIEYIVGQLLTENQLEELYREKEMDSSYAIGDKGRFRVNVFFERRTLAVAFRYIPTKLPNLEELALPTMLYEFCKLPQGLVLITGASGQGKSTTIAALINWINQNKNAHIITIEDPIEYMFTSNKALIQQREIRIDTLRWTHALKSALREDANIILIGEIRDYETMNLAITAAEKGHLVLATIHTYSADQTIEHVIGMFPEHQQHQARMQFAAVLEGTVTQNLVKGIDPSKRYPAIELMIATNAIKNIIREGNAQFIYNNINTNFDIGMITMEKSLAELVNSGKVELDEALAKAKHPNEMLRYINKK